jgi:hypothetical protein
MTSPSTNKMDVYGTLGAKRERKWSVNNPKASATKRNMRTISAV